MRGLVKHRWNYLTARLASRWEEIADPKVQIDQAIGEAQKQYRWREGTGSQRDRQPGADRTTARHERQLCPRSPRCGTVAGILLLTMSAGVLTGCGVGGEERSQDAETDQTILTGESRGSSSDNAEQQYQQDIDPVRLGNRFGWCWELQTVWDEHAFARSHYQDANSALDAATDELDRSEAMIVHENAALLLQRVEEDALNILREAVGASEDSLGDRPKAIAYTRAWESFVQSDNSAAAFENVNEELKAIFDRVPDELLDPTLLDKVALNAAEDAVSRAKSAITAAVRDGSYKSVWSQSTWEWWQREWENVVAATESSYRTFVVAVSAIAATEDPSDSGERQRDTNTFIEIGSELPLTERTDLRTSQYSNIVKARRGAYFSVSNLGIVQNSNGDQLARNSIGAKLYNSEMYGSVVDYNMGDWLGDFDIYSWANSDRVEVLLERRDISGNGFAVAKHPIAAALQVWLKALQDASVYAEELESVVFATLIRDGGAAYDAFQKSFQDSCREN